MLTPAISRIRRMPDIQGTNGVSMSDFLSFLSFDVIKHIFHKVHSQQNTCSVIPTLFRSG